MKTKDFIKELENLGFNVSLLDKRVVVIRNYKGEEVAKTFTYRPYSFYNNYTGFNNLNNDKKHKLFKLLARYADTPIEDREDEKRYQYITKASLNGVDFLEDHLCLNYNKYSQKWQLNTQKDNEDYQTIFTHSDLLKYGVDIDELKQKYYEIEVK